jgi:diguanylate cyclase (GGDEF)-like protein/PAS domain S-box-containing protein
VLIQGHIEVILQFAKDKVSLEEETNSMFHTFFEQGAYYSGVLNLDGTLIETNRKSLVGCGYSRDSVIGKKFWECYWWNRSADIMDIIQNGCAIAANGQLFKREVTYFKADGSSRIVDLTLSPVIDEAGMVLFIAATGIDITKRKQAEAALRASEERFRLLTELSPDAILVDMQDRFVYANPAAVHLFGAARIDDIYGRTSFDITSPEFHDVIRQAKDLLLAKQQPFPVLDLKLRRLDEKIIDVQVLSAPVTWEGQPAVQTIVRNVSETKRTKEKFRILNERLKIASEGTGQGFWDWNIPHKKFTFLSGLNRILGLTCDDSPTTAAEWVAAIHPDDKERTRLAFYSCIEGKTPIYESEYRLRVKDGSWKWVWARGMIVERDESGQPVTITGTLTDITAKKRSEELTWQHANLDVLTGLLNRRLFCDRLESEIFRAKRSHCYTALLFIDLDGFKQVNDLYGHEAGDRLLIEMAYRLKSCVRTTDAIARLGGDEFTIILAELSNLDHVEFVCQKILTQVSSPFFFANEAVYVSCSIGVSLYPLDDSQPEELIRKADRAMYIAKQSGKNQFHYFTKEMDDKAHLRLHTTNELRYAYKNNGLSLHYQPILNLQEGKVLKVEALLRWHHPLLGEIGPSEFIPLAEEAGLILPISRWVLQTACLQNVIWQRSGLPPIRLAVNLSARHVISPTLLSDIKDALHISGMEAELLELELTESMVVRNPEVANNLLMEIKKLGVKVAIDDFGTGYSSLAQLKNFPIDTLKVDRSFIQDLPTSHKDQCMTKAIIAMGKSLGLKVVAEGVETEEQHTFLRKHACDETQGFYFSKPVPSEGIVTILRGQGPS